MSNTLTSSLRPLLVTLLTIFFLANQQASAAKNSNHHNINLVRLGAKADGKTDSSKAFMAAWNAACATATPTTILVPKGRYMVRSALVFRGKNCRSSSINFVVRGTILSPADYRVLGKSSTWFAFDDVTGVSITGGVFDGRGAGLWTCKSSAEPCPSGATTLRFSNSRNIAISGVTSLNSQLYHLVFDGCNDVNVQGVTISASGNSPNTDGIHVQQSNGVTILNSNVATGDDCVSIGAGTHDLWIENMNCGPGHGISIGSLGKELNEPGVTNVTVKTATFTGTENGVRIKSWGRQTNGYVRHVSFQHITMVNAGNPIIIDQHYCPHEKGCPGTVSGVRISDVTYQDIHGSSSSPVAIKFDCSSEYHCSDIKLDGINLTYKNHEAQSSCDNAVGTTSGLIKPKISCF